MKTQERQRVEPNRIQEAEPRSLSIFCTSSLEWYLLRCFNVRIKKLPQRFLKRAWEVILEDVCSDTKTAHWFWKTHHNFF